MLTVLDEYTREALCVAVAITMDVADVLDVLYPLVLKRGKPEYSSLDNGPEFSAAPLQDWLRRVGIQPIRIYPGSPWENGYNERFNGAMVAGRFLRFLLVIVPVRDVGNWPV